MDIRYLDADIIKNEHGEKCLSITITGYLKESEGFSRESLKLVAALNNYLLAVLMLRQEGEAVSSSSTTKVALGLDK